MDYFDIHTHRLPDKEKDILFILNCMPDNGNPLSDQLVSDFRGYYSIGIHPGYIADTERQLQEVREACTHRLVIAVGEAGLDKLADAFLPEQIKIFKIQALLAEEFGKPLIIHCVKAWAELISVRKELNPKMPWIIHGFRGNGQLASQLIKQGFYLSFGGLFNPEALQMEYLNRILAETDDSDLSICNVYQRLATSMQIDAALFSNTLRDNVRKVFAI